MYSVYVIHIWNPRHPRPGHFLGILSDQIDDPINYHVNNKTGVYKYAQRTGSSFKLGCLKHLDDLQEAQLFYLDLKWYTDYLSSVCYYCINFRVDNFNMHHHKPHRGLDSPLLNIMEMRESIV